MSVYKKIIIFSIVYVHNHVQTGQLSAFDPSRWDSVCRHLLWQFLDGVEIGNLHIIRHDLIDLLL